MTIKFGPIFIVYSLNENWRDFLDTQYYLPKSAMNEWMNEIVYCYSVKLYIKHNIDMVHIIVDKHMNKINKNSSIAKGYRIAAQRL